MAISIDSAKKTAASLWIVNLFSIAACTFSYIYISYLLYRDSHNVMLSELALFAPMLMPVLLIFQIHGLVDRFPPKALMVAANSAGALLCLGLAAGATSGPYPLLALVLAIGALDAVLRVARIVAIKRYFSAEEVKLTVPLTFVAQFVAGGAAGLVLALVKEDLAPAHAFATVAAFFAMAALGGLSLSRLPESSRSVPGGRTAVGVWRDFRALLARHPALTRSFAAFVLFISVYQGFFNVSRVALPAHTLGLSSQYVGLLQLVNGVAAMLGAGLFYFGARRRGNWSVAALSLGSAVFMVLASAGWGVEISYAAYFVYIVLFEVAFFQLQADLVTACPSEDMPLLATLQYAAVYLGMMAAILAGGALLHRAGLLVTALAFCAAYLLLRRLLPGRPAAMPAPALDSALD